MAIPGYSFNDLYEMLSVLKNDAEGMYRYGELSHSQKIFLSLSSIDQKRLLALAFFTLDGDLHNVAERLLSKVEPPIATEGEMLALISKTERDVLKAFVKNKDRSGF